MVRKNAEKASNKSVIIREYKGTMRTYPNTKSEFFCCLTLNDQAILLLICPIAKGVGFIESEGFRCFQIRQWR